MEERIIDDEYGRGIRLKKTKDGYVDATDELVNGQDEEVTEEMQFELPVLEMDEDDEDLVGLSPEEALKLRREKEEKARARRAEYERLCAEGQACLDAEDFAGAETAFEQALDFDDEHTDASVGYWRAKTQNFANPDALVSEYADSSIESLEYELGIDAVDHIKKEYHTSLQCRYDELCEEEKPLAQSWEAKHAHRKSVLKERLKNAVILFLCITVPMIACGVLTAVIGMKNFTTREHTFVLPTVLLGIATFILFIAFVFASNKWLNVMRMMRANERLDSTEEGEKLMEIRDYKEIYACLVQQEGETTEQKE